MKKGDFVTGEVLFGEGLVVTGQVIRSDAEISRDAIIVQSELDGREYTVLSKNAKRIYMYKIDKPEDIIITRQESNFDRACDAANKRALSLFGCDEYGDLTDVEGYDRHSCSIEIKFIDYRAGLGFMGTEYTYRFEATVVRYEEEDEA